MGRVKESGGGGFKIKNATETEYYAESGEIGSGNFLQFGRSGALYDGARKLTGSYYYISATNLTDTRVLVHYSTSTTSGRVVSLFDVNGTELKLLHTLTVASTERAPYNYDIERISNTQAILTYVNDQNYLCSRVVTMTGDEISLGTAVTVSSIKISLETAMGKSKIAVLSPSKIAIVYRMSEDPSRDYYIAIVSVSGSTITVEKNQVIHSIGYTGTYYGNAYSVIGKIDGNRACVLVTDTDDNNSYDLKALVVTISDSYAVSLGSTVTLTSGYLLGIVGYGGIQLKNIDASRVAVTYMNTADLVMARILSISGSTISAGTAVSTGLYTYSQTNIDAILFDSSTLVFCGQTSASGDWDTLCRVMTINGATLTAGISYNLGYGNNGGALGKTKDRFIVLGSMDSASSGAMYYDMPTTKAVNIAKPYVDSVWGVSKTKATTLKPGKAFLPKA